MLKTLALAVADGALPLVSLQPFHKMPLQPHPVPEAPASRMKRLAQSAVSEMPEHLVSQGLRSAARDSPIEHAERDLLRLFRSLGMSAALPIDLHQFGIIFVAHLRIDSWFRMLLKEQSNLLLAGFAKHQPESELAMKCFWSNFKATVPDHQIFRTHHDRLGHCLPYYLFLDEVVGLRKSGVLIVSWEPVVGSETSKAFAEKLAQAGRRCDRMRIMTESQTHAARGRTWNTGFLYTVLPKKAYKKGEVFTKLLGKIATECAQVMQDGVTLRGVTYYPICIGLKGDAPMQAKCGCFKRSFQNMGYNKGCCFECKAGIIPYNFEDVGLNPGWEATIFQERPYITPSPLLATLLGRMPHLFTSSSNQSAARFCHRRLCF